MSDANQRGDQLHTPDSSRASAQLSIQDRSPQDGLFGRFVLPQSEHGPSIRHQGSRLETITLDVARQFGDPVSLVRVRWTAVLGAAVPEATVDENGQPDLCEDDVRPDPLAADPQQEILAKPQTTAMQGRAQQTFRLGIGSVDRPHIARTAR